MRRLREAAPKFSPKAFFTQSPRSLIMLVAFGVVGTALLVASQAATPTSSYEVENGTITGASSESGNGASGDGYVRFGIPYTDLFVSKTGSDSNNGSSEALAVKTIGKAITLAGPQTRIRVKTGSYIEQLQITKDDIAIEPFGDGDVEINGAIPEFITGKTAGGSTLPWEIVSTGVYKYNLNRKESSSYHNPVYTADGTQQWTYGDLVQFNTKNTRGQLEGIYLNDVLGLGLTDEVYVYTKTNQKPVAPLYIGAKKPTIDLNGANNIRIRGITGSKLKVSYGSVNVQIRNSSNNVRVDNVEITGGKAGLTVIDSSNVSLTNSNVHGDFDPAWDWADVKEVGSVRSMENQAILVRAEKTNMANILIENNTISGYFNGVNMPYLWDKPCTPHCVVSDSIVSNNTIHDVSDDAIEIEAPLSNLSVKNNWVYDSYSPISATSVVGGPVYVYENTIIADRTVTYAGTIIRGPSYALKMNNDSTGPPPENIHYYYNTFYFSGNGANLKKTVQSENSQGNNRITKDVSFINNVFYAYDGGIIRGTGRVVDNINFDGNLFYSEKPGTENFYAWNTFYNTPVSYAKLSDIESAGAMPAEWQGNVEATPTFNCVDPLNRTCFRVSAGVTKPSTMQQIPGTFADSSRLNGRKRIGAFE